MVQQLSFKFSLLLNFPPDLSRWCASVAEWIPTVYIFFFVSDLTRSHWHCVNKREMDLYVWTWKVNTAQPCSVTGISYKADDFSSLIKNTQRLFFSFLFFNFYYLNVSSCPIGLAFHWKLAVKPPESFKKFVSPLFRIGLKTVTITQ